MSTHHATQPGQPTATTPVRAHAVVHARGVVLTQELTRAQQIAPTLAGVITELCNTPATLSAVRAAMNTVHPEPTATGSLPAIGSIQVLAVAMRTAIRAAVALIYDHGIPDMHDGQSCIRVQHLLSCPPPAKAREATELLAIALHERVIEVITQHPLRVRMLSHTPAGVTPTAPPIAHTAASAPAGSAA